MKDFISHYSAAKIWDIPYIETVFDSKILEMDTVDITIARRDERFSQRGVKLYLCQLPLPPSAVVLRNGQRVASPELVFLQLATKLSPLRHILLGLQLCSNPPGKPLAAISTKQKLKIFLTKTTGHRGNNRALQSLRYIEDGSASVMESLAHMILTLPHSLGGYGLKGAIFNHEIKLGNEGVLRLGKKRCFADLYYKSHKLAVEYESFAFHNSPLEQGRDIIRAAILEKQGVGVMRLSTLQLYDEDACMDFAINLASRLGKRIQIRTNGFKDNHKLIRELLPIGGTCTDSK
ncbi:MAG: hypothetical protein RBS48_11690 [Ignavibacteriaceae bacterium]|jgi:hypothetical protein|nr:hypothetical protein [Ignavibacteriaceae bacterium]